MTFRMSKEFPAGRCIPVGKKYGVFLISKILSFRIWLIQSQTAYCCRLRRNCEGVIAPGNHWISDSLRGAPPHISQPPVPKSRGLTAEGELPVGQERPPWGVSPRGEALSFIERSMFHRSKCSLSPKGFSLEGEAVKNRLFGNDF